MTDTPVAAPQDLHLEEDIKTRYCQKFPALADKIHVARRRRLFAELPEAQFRAVFDYAYKELGFTIMLIITGHDERTNLAAQYHIARTDGIILNLKSIVSREEPLIHTVTDVFPSAHIYERELVDLLGFKVEGLPPGNRYPLPDNWPEGHHPLRKDWTPDMLTSKKEDT